MFRPVLEIWSDRPVYVIGGGTSLAGFDLDQVPGRKVGVNRSAFATPCEVCFTLDQNFLRHDNDRLRAFARAGGTVIAAMSSEPDQSTIAGTPVDDFHMIHLRRERGLSTRPDAVHGVNSGFGALNLAFICGAREIHLLGLDMQYGRDGSTHFHGGYAWHNKNSHRWMNNWANDFDLAAIQLARAGVKVTNWIGTPRSKITAFPVRPLEELLPRQRSAAE